jgi:putative transposase
VRSIKDECLDRMILVGEASLRRAIDEFIVHYHSERNHQGLGNELIREPDRDGTADRPVRRRQRLGGMLSFYYRAAA